jgi:hypothetical protein
MSCVETVAAAAGFARRGSRTLELKAETDRSRHGSPGEPDFDR